MSERKGIFLPYIPDETINLNSHGVNLIAFKLDEILSLPHYVFNLFTYISSKLSDMD